MKYIVCIFATSIVIGTGCRDEITPYFDDLSSSSYNSDTTETSNTLYKEITDYLDTSTSTGDLPQAYCGDKILDEGEECDEVGIFCNELCIRSRIIFISSKTFLPSELNGIFNSSKICQQLAKDAGLQNWEVYESWLSNSYTNARDRINPSKGKYITTGKTLVASDFEDLLDGEIKSPIVFNEYGESINDSLVWTGTDGFGFRVIDSDHCDDWSLNEVSKTGVVGNNNKLKQWSNSWYYNPWKCASLNSIYCIEGK